MPISRPRSHRIGTIAAGPDSPGHIPGPSIIQCAKTCNEFNMQMTIVFPHDATAAEMRGAWDIARQTLHPHLKLIAHLED